MRKESIRKWQNQWEETTKGAITKEFLVIVQLDAQILFNVFIYL